MHLRASYNKLVLRANQYLTEKREQSHWRHLLPARIFDPHLWLWEQRSIARGAGWGACLAILPIPMQSIATIFPCLWTRGNIPVAILSCWISIPGYQVIAWPLQWALGAWLMDMLSPWSSGASLASVYHAVSLWSQGWQSILAELSGVRPELLAIEFLLGCLVSSALLGYLFYLITRVLPKSIFTDPSTASSIK